jgi:hypothetical protein
MAANVAGGASVRARVGKPHDADFEACRPRVPM